MAQVYSSVRIAMDLMVSIHLGIALRVAAVDDLCCLPLAAR